jgi:hypothetical protein
MGKSSPSPFYPDSIINMCECNFRKGQICDVPTLQMGQGCRPIVARRASREALGVFSLGSFHEPIARLQG